MASALFAVAFLTIFGVSAGRPLHLGSAQQTGTAVAVAPPSAGGAPEVPATRNLAAVGAGMPLHLGAPAAVRGGAAQEVADAVVVAEKGQPLHMPVAAAATKEAPAMRGLAAVSRGTAQKTGAAVADGAHEVAAEKLGAVGAVAKKQSSRAYSAGSAQKALVVPEIPVPVPGAGAAPDAEPDAALHHPAARTNRPVIIGVVVVVVVVLGAIAVVAIWLCVKKRKRAAREPRARAPSSLPRVHQPQEASAELELGRREEVAGAATGESNGCRLCRRPYGLEGDEAPLTLSCGDRFHRRCIRRWVKENLSCPICNSTQIVLLGLGATGGAETSRRYLSGCEMQTRDDSVLGRSTFAF